MYVCTRIVFNESDGLAEESIIGLGYSAVAGCRSLYVFPQCGLWVICEQLLPASSPIMCFVMCSPHPATAVS